MAATRCARIRARDRRAASLHGTTLAALSDPDLVDVQAIACARRLGTLARDASEPVRVAGDPTAARARKAQQAAIDWRAIAQRYIKLHGDRGPPLSRGAGASRFTHEETSASRCWRDPEEVVAGTSIAPHGDGRRRGCSPIACGDRAHGAAPDPAFSATRQVRRWRSSIGPPSPALKRRLQPAPEPGRIVGRYKLTPRSRGYDGTTRASSEGQSTRKSATFKGEKLGAGLALNDVPRCGSRLLRSR